jgi:hypothetical protein
VQVGVVQMLPDELPGARAFQIFVSVLLFAQNYVIHLFS